MIGDYWVFVRLWRPENKLPYFGVEIKTRLSFFTTLFISDKNFANPVHAQIPQELPRYQKNYPQTECLSPTLTKNSTLGADQFSLA